MKNSTYHMIIRVTDIHLKDAFLAKARELGLTISNDNDTKTGIEHIQLGHAISVGTSDKFHVNWARRIDYYADRAIVPVYDIQHDWAQIKQRLEAYANAIKVQEEEDSAYYLNDGSEVSIDKDNESIDIDNVTFSKGDLAMLLEIFNVAERGSLEVDFVDQTVTFRDDDNNITFEIGELRELLDKLD